MPKAKTTNKTFTRSEFKRLVNENEMLQLKVDHYKNQVEILSKLVKIPPVSNNSDDKYDVWNELAHRVSHLIFISRDDEKIKKLSLLNDNTYREVIKMLERRGL